MRGSSAERWRRVQEVLDVALELPAEDRGAFLDRACAGDGDLRREVEQLVAACEEAGPLFELPAPAFGAPLLVDPAAGAELRDRLSTALGSAYTIERELPGAGMSRLFVASETALRRRVVIKVLAPGLRAAVNAERFLREIQLTARLQHPHIIPLLSAGEAGGLLYYTMPFVEGESLRARLAREGRVPPADAVRLLLDIVDALAYAHGQLVVHRDLKPENILLSRGHALVLDFGIAKALGTEGRVLTRSGFTLGTPVYMAPEQIVSDPRMDHRADLYALGVVAYELLAGAPPFAGPTRDLITAHLHQAPEPLRNRQPLVPAPLAELVMRCLEKEPSRRPQSAGEVTHELRALESPGMGMTSASRIRWASLTAAVILAAILGLALLARPRSDGVVLGGVEQMTIETGLELDPTLSPDGKAIAYAADSSGQMRLYVRQASGGPAVAISEGLPGYHRAPRWSPDGGRIAFQSGGSIYQVPTTGGVPRLLVAPAPGKWVAYPAWSPDGNEIAYVEDWAIYRRRADGGPPRLVLPRPAAHSLAWSPDGRWIAFVSGNPMFTFGEAPWGSPVNLGSVAPSAVWVVAAEGGEPVRVTDDGSLNGSPVWLPRGRGLLFVSNREGSRDIYQVRLAGSGAPVGAPTRLTTGLGAHTVSLSARARRLVYSAYTRNTNIWSIRVPETPPISVSEATPVTSGSQNVEGLALSADGHWLAFDSDRNGNQDLYRMPVTGSDPVRLTTDSTDDFVSSWSPDGRELALDSYGTGSGRVRVLSLERDTMQEVVHSPANQRSPGWSPDGQSLAFTSDASGRLELFVVSRTAGSWGVARRLTLDGGWAGRWSPNGDQIVYCRPDGLWLIAPQGGAPHQVLRVEDSTQPAPELAQWSPDGRTIYYKALDAAGHSSLWSMPAAGGASRLMVRFDDPSRPSTRPEFATDGRRFFFTIGHQESDIWLADVTSGW